MRKIFVCSPLSGDIKKNIDRARAYSRFVTIEHKSVPITPHIYFTQFLNENNLAERNLGISMGIELLLDCNELWVFGNTISHGMQEEIKTWEEKGLSYRQFKNAEEIYEEYKCDEVLML